ncbi:hypothetical protein BDZ85DRAFT_66468 [Elsinoe ampelina]|uniref:Uncharacterized protein n=1 Tax=Elsinoe ampelina TaxID=302913 RepID=A0A6A6GIC1_9PEZI|nr:hypothetical protein BDZ85DRAFT_66468 [Elsinoe ampelina]
MCKRTFLGSTLRSLHDPTRHRTCMTQPRTRLHPSRIAHLSSRPCRSRRRPLSTISLAPHRRSATMMLRTRKCRKLDDRGREGAELVHQEMTRLGFPTTKHTDEGAEIADRAITLPRTVPRATRTISNQVAMLFIDSLVMPTEANAIATLAKARQSIGDPQNEGGLQKTKNLMRALTPARVFMTKQAKAAVEEYTTLTSDDGKHDFKITLSEMKALHRAILAPTSLALTVI